MGSDEVGVELEGVGVDSDGEIVVGVEGDEEEVEDVVVEGGGVAVDVVPGVELVVGALFAVGGVVVMGLRYLYELYEL